MVKSLVAILILGLLGLAAFLALIKDISPGASADFTLSRGQIMDLSNGFMRERGYHLAGLHQDAWFQYDTRTDLFLQRRYGMAKANGILRADTLPAHAWLVTWYDRNLSQSQNTERFTAWISPGGRVLGFDHTISDTATLASLPAREAQARAESLLVLSHPDLAAYHLKTSSAKQQLHRTDHEFVYSRESDGLELTLTARVQGNEVGSVEWTSVLSGEFMRGFSALETDLTLTATVSIAATFLLFFFVVVLFLKKYHEGEVGIRTAALTFLVYVGLALLVSMNEITSLGANTGIGDLNKFYVRIVVFVVNVFILRVFLGVLVFAAWSVGESSSRAIWPQKLVSIDSALFGRFFTRDVAVSVLRGYGWGFLVLGLHALLVAGLVRSGVSFLAGQAGASQESLLPGLQPVLVGLGLAVFGEVVNRLFFISYLREHARTLWLAPLVSVAVWTVSGYFSWQLPFGATNLGLHLLLLAAYGVVFAMLFLRYDLLTAITAHAVIIAMSTAIPSLASSGAYFAGQNLLFACLLAVPPGLAVVGFIRNERFEFDPASLPTHIQRISERVRMAKELEIARNVQLSLLPREQPRLPGFDIAGTCLPAEEVGGDYFDFVRLSEEKLGIALGDVSGKGVPAAIYMTLTKGILQSHAEETVRPRVVLAKVNSLMYRTIERNSFVSMLYAVLDHRLRTFRFARAGQCPVILCQEAGGDGTIVTPAGMALGLERGDVFEAVLEERELSLVEGEILVLYTDGFTEAMNETEEEFGEKRLLESVARNRALSAAAVIQAVHADIRAFAGAAPQHDDMTMVVVKVLPGPAA